MWNFKFSFAQFSIPVNYFTFPKINVMPKGFNELSYSQWNLSENLQI